MKLSLIVLYTRQLLEMKGFYESLGLTFKLEKHGNGPEHYYAKLGERLGMELYPITSDKVNNPLSHPHRLEFTAGDINNVVHQLIDNGWKDHMGWRDSKRGGLYLVDPDGNEVMVNPPQFPIKWMGIESVQV